MSTPEGARKSGLFVAVCLYPDYCWTPTGDGKEIVPYMIGCDLSESIGCSPNVYFADGPAFLYKASCAPSVKGNEPACEDGGKQSSVKNGLMWVEEHESSVLVNGIPTVRHGDACWMNSKI